MRKTQSSGKAPVEDSAEVDRQFVSALARGLDILCCFDAAHPELGSAEIAEMTGLPQPTVWRLCYTLVKCGYLVQSARNERFRIGLGVLGLGHSTVWSANRRDLVLQEMQQVAHMSDCAVSLAIPDKGDMLIIERCTPQSMLIVNLQVGSRLPMATSAMGWAYLAALPEERRQALIKALGLSRNQAAKKDIDDAVSLFRKKGYVTNAARFHPEINAIAVPVAMPDSAQFLAINCGGPASVATIRMLEKDIAPRLVALAHSIGRALNAADFALPRMATA